MNIEFTALINPEEKRHELHSALAFAAVGILFLTLTFLLLQKPLPSSGVFLLLLSPFNALHLRRYREMRRQEKAPDKFLIQDDAIIYFANKNRCLSIPISAIARIEYRDGLAMFLKQPTVQQIAVLHPDFSFSSFMAKAKRKKCDLFFEWFPRDVARKVGGLTGTSR